jgi:anti-sigma regulatory factor (Ser/Thr protein kinase)
VPPPPQTARTHEIRQVEEAFASVQQTAVAAAVGQAQLRQGISDMFRNLARRSQSLLHRQLALLDAMERRAKDPQELDDLFRADHLATRMRRHAESLIILSGETPARGWRQPVPMVDVLRAAVGEVEDYTRIKVSTASQASLTGPAAGDVIHIVAELAENATIYSPPQTAVTIRGYSTDDGYTVEVEDRGLGISPTHRQQLNSLLTNPPAFDLSGGDQLGLFVAAQLAQRHSVRLSLRASPYGGITAVVQIPSDLVMPEPAMPAGPPVRLVKPVRLVTPPRLAAPPRAAAPPPAPARVTPAPPPAAPPRQAASPAPVPASRPPASPPPALPPRPTPPPRPASPPPPASPVPPAAPPPPAVPARADAVPAGSGNGRAERPGESTEPLSVAAAAPSPAAGGAPNRPAGDVPDQAAAGAPSLPGRLPRRIPQASLAPHLRNGQAQALAPPDPPVARERSPEQTRQALTALQRGWERGRSVFDPLPPGSGNDVTGPDEPEPAAGDLAADAASGHPDRPPPTA